MTKRLVSPMRSSLVKLALRGVGDSASRAILQTILVGHSASKNRCHPRKACVFRVLYGGDDLDIAGGESGLADITPSLAKVDGWIGRQR